MLMTFILLKKKEEIKVKWSNLSYFNDNNSKTSSPSYLSFPCPLSEGNFMKGLLIFFIVTFLPSTYMWSLPPHFQKLLSLGSTQNWEFQCHLLDFFLKNSSLCSSSKAGFSKIMVCRPNLGCHLLLTSWELKMALTFFSSWKISKEEEYFTTCEGLHGIITSVSINNILWNPDMHTPLCVVCGCSCAYNGRVE